MDLDFSKANILVIGDVICDKFWFANTKRISPEAPVAIAHIKNKQIKAGGAANVAMNIRSLQGGCTLIGVVGQDENATTLKQILEQSKISNELLIDTTIPTTTKIRVISQHQQMIRLDFEEPILAHNTQKIEHCFAKHINNINTVVLSDYAKGTLSDCLRLIEIANKKNLNIICDPKGDCFKKYYGATLLTPNLKEFERIVGQCTDTPTLVERAFNMINMLQLKALLITLGSKGMLLILDNGKHHFLDAKAQEVFDVTGAGDTVTAMMALALSQELSFSKAAQLANTAASISVQKLGTHAVNLQELTIAMRD